MPAPSQYPEWATNDEVDALTSANNKVEPTVEFKLSGLKRGEYLARPFLNYQFATINDWLVYLNSRNIEYDMSAETDISPDNGKYQTLTLTANTTLTESMVGGEDIYLLLTPASFSITAYPASFDWGDAGAPTLLSENLIHLVKIGSTVYATLEWSKT